MASCPECNGYMRPGDTACPSCGYTFVSSPADHSPGGLAWSKLADVALSVGRIVSGLFCVLIVVGVVQSLWESEWINGLVVRPLAFLLVLANYVVLTRVEGMKR